MDAGFPAIFALMSAKTTACYDALWAHILNLIPEMAENVTTVSSDFERAQINSAKRNFPRARMAGCLFHIKQAMTKKWSNLNIPMEYDDILEKAYAIPHLPANKISEGVDYIQAQVDIIHRQGREHRDKLQDFVTYLQTVWVPLANVVSVYENPIRTNNTTENFHLIAGKKMGVRPAVWKMLDEMKKIMITTEERYLNAVRGRRDKPGRPMSLQLADLAIIKAERDLSTGHFTVEDFVSHVASLRRLELARVHLGNAAVRQANDVPSEDDTTDDSSEDESGNENNLNGGVFENDDSSEDENEQARQLENYIGDDVELEQGVQFFLDNLHLRAGAGGQFENELVIRRRRRVLVLQDAMLMLENANDQALQVNAEVAAVAHPAAGRGRGRAPRGGGRPRRNQHRAVAAQANGLLRAANDQQPQVNLGVAAAVQLPAEPGRGRVPRGRGRPRQQRAAAAEAEEEVDAANDQVPQADAEVAADVQIEVGQGRGRILRDRGRPRHQRAVVAEAEEPLEAANDEHPPADAGIADEGRGREPRSRSRPRLRSTVAEAEEPLEAANNEEPQAGAVVANMMNPTADQERGRVHRGEGSPVQHQQQAAAVEFNALPQVAGIHLPLVNAVAAVVQPPVDRDGDLPVELIEADQQMIEDIVDPREDEEPIPVVNVEHQRKKKKIRRAGKTAKCISCFGYKKVQLLRPCRHRLCNTCANEWYKLRRPTGMTCPFCRQIVESWLPREMMPDMSAPVLLDDVIEID